MITAQHKRLNRRDRRETSKRTRRKAKDKAFDRKDRKEKLRKARGENPIAFCLERDFYRKFEGAGCAEGKDAGAEAEAIAVGLLAGGSVDRSRSSAESAAERVGRAIEVGKI